MNPADLATFKSQGVVFVRGLLPPALIEHWRSQVWDTMTIDRDRPGEWTDGGVRNIGHFKPEHRERIVYPYTDSGR